MASRKVPHAALAQEFLLRHRVQFYAQDFYVHDPRLGVYRVVGRDGFARLVQHFLVDQLGACGFQASDVESVARCALFEAHLDERCHPPFWLGTGTPARVVVASNVFIDLDAYAAGERRFCRRHTDDLFAVARLPFPYKASAACPRWRAFVSWMAGGDEGVARLLQEYCGYTLVSHLLNVQQFLWLQGGGSNGKSTFLQVVRYVLGEENVSSVGLRAFTGGAFALWPLLFKTANICADAAVDRRMNVAGLKGFVGRDPLTIPRKYKSDIVVAPCTTLFFASNDLPEFRDQSDGLWRRLLLVQLRQRVERGNPRLVEELKREGSGILNWMLEPIPGLLARGRLQVPDSVRRDADAIRDAVNPAREYLAEKVERGSDDDFLDRDTVMDLFGAWCDRNRVRADELRVVKAEMARMFAAAWTRRRVPDAAAGTDNRRHGWAGVRWKSGEGPGQQHSLADRLVKNQRERVTQLEQENADLRAGLEHSHGQWKVVFGRRSPTPPVVHPGPVSAPSADPTAAGGSEEVTPELQALLDRLTDDETEGGPAAGGAR